MNLEFQVFGSDKIGRQSQTFVNFPEIGWKVVAAHVSATDGTPSW